MGSSGQAPRASSGTRGRRDGVLGGVCALEQLVEGLVVDNARMDLAPEVARGSRDAFRRGISERDHPGAEALVRRGGPQCDGAKAPGLDRRQEGDGDVVVGDGLHREVLGERGAEYVGPDVATRLQERAETPSVAALLGERRRERSGVNAPAWTSTSPRGGRVGVFTGAGSAVQELSSSGSSRAEVEGQGVRTTRSW